jgi:uncharacterized membrane protein
MEGWMTEWLNMLLRWLHVIVAVAWIGESFYFVALDNGLRPARPPARLPAGVFGEFWHVHGGGFYHIQKYTVAPAEMPGTLHWSFWPSYTTWLSGFSLFAALYLLNPSTYLVDPGLLAMPAGAAIAAAIAFLVAGWIVYDALCRACGPRDRLLGAGVAVYVAIAAWAACHVFAGRAAYLITGAMLATIMSANVAMVIIPGQRKMVAAMLRGEQPDPIYGKRGKQRSVHNTYFTLPVVFAMVSNHYAFTYGHRDNWAVLLLIMAAGALIRQFFVLRHRGQSRAWLPVAGAALLGCAAGWTLPRPAAPAGAGAATPLHVADIAPVLAARCVQCHSARPTLVGSAPAGVVLDSPAAIAQNAQRIYQQAVQLRTMPLGNVTQMTDAERARIGAWFTAGALR